MTLDKPENRVELKPETEKIKGEEWQIWDTTFGTDKESGRYWISCVYHGGQTWLSQLAPVSSKSCRTPFLEDPEGQRIDQYLLFVSRYHSTSVYVLYTL